MLKLLQCWLFSFLYIYQSLGVVCLFIARFNIFRSFIFLCTIYWIILDYLNWSKSIFSSISVRIMKWHRWMETITKSEMKAYHTRILTVRSRQMFFEKVVKIIPELYLSISFIHMLDSNKLFTFSFSFHWSCIKTSFYKNGSYIKRILYGS